MIQNIPFTTRARTIDHLGREQIADTPTAISELWKNAYDAYAQNVELHIFDGEEPVAAIYDDGHGMNYDEFVSKWLVVGTETKIKEAKTSTTDRLGLSLRPRQGQKGIGRLSAANLGPLLFVISKRKSDDFVASLIDWRIFENPFLNLDDIEIPVTQFSQKDEALKLLPELFDNLIGNVWGGDRNRERKNRIEAAWKAFDMLSKDQDDKNNIPPSKLISEGLLSTSIEERHIEHWPVWDASSKTGTTLLISNINDDLRNYLASSTSDASKNDAKEVFFETLSGFVDPYTSEKNIEVNAKPIDFRYAVKVWNENQPEVVVSDIKKEYSRFETSRMEHVLEGTVDDLGVFRGQIKAFGEWRKTGNKYEILPPKDVRISTRKGGALGPVNIYIATFERDRSNSSHSDADFARFNELAKKHSGLMVYRNGLRVLPYGRVDNDFFQIEMRRSKQAGREFWNARRIFGRIAISTEHNPNLRDKSGREGFIDNRAAKTLRVLIINILKRSARDYFGYDSSIREPTLENTRTKNKKAKAEKERNKLRTRHRNQFRATLGKSLTTVPLLLRNIEVLSAELDLSNEEKVEQVKISVEEAYQELGNLRLPDAPAELGLLEDDFRQFLSYISKCNTLLTDMEEQVSIAMQGFQPERAEDFLYDQVERLDKQYKANLNNWQKKITKLQSKETARLQEIVDKCQGLFVSETDYIIPAFADKKGPFSGASEAIDEIFAELSETNEEIFGSYVGALESLSDTIDIQAIAQFSGEQYEELRSEVDRLNSLAQVGIAVEILGHELQSFDDMLSSGLAKLPKDIHKTDAYRNIQAGHQGLIDYLQFLSPMKISGTRTRMEISGSFIEDYLDTFFYDTLSRNDITLEATRAFQNFSVIEQESRILPVFINLINNSVYWLTTSNIKDKTIMLSVQDEKVLVSDNGPGIDEIDEKNLFNLFFTRKATGGRGVGLYLCRSNLSAGGHSIEYLGKNLKIKKPLDGANFAIHFIGGKYGNRT